MGRLYIVCNMFVAGRAVADVAVLGAGPAGLAIAAACAGRGLKVRLLAPDPDAPWERTFGVWERDLAAVGDVARVESAWRRPRVVIDEGEEVELDATYVRLDARTLQERQRAACARAGVAIERGAARGLEHDALGSEVVLGDRRLRARFVVDATGPGTPFVQRVDAREPAFQSAWGELVEVDVEPAMTLMDLRGPDDAPPSFLYALPLGGGRAFLEETVLASRPAVPHDELARRLDRRLRGMGVRRRRTLEHERCTIPMGVPRPRRGQRVVAFGAAASFVHPATGYQLARCFAAAGPVADALVAARDPAAGALGAHDASWPADARRAWDLYTFGLEVICRLGAPRIRAFQRAFFSLPTEAWLGFLRGVAPPSAVAASMLRLLLRAELGVSADILRLMPVHLRTLTRAWIAEEPA
jgi:lycopene cyclase-like protein